MLPGAVVSLLLSVDGSTGVSTRRDPAGTHATWPLSAVLRARLLRWLRCLVILDLLCASAHSRRQDGAPARHDFNYVNQGVRGRRGPDATFCMLSWPGMLLFQARLVVCSDPVPGRRLPCLGPAASLTGSHTSICRAPDTVAGMPRPAAVIDTIGLANRHRSETEVLCRDPFFQLLGSVRRLFPAGLGHFGARHWRASAAARALRSQYPHGTLRLHRNAYGKVSHPDEAGSGCAPTGWPHGAAILGSTGPQRLETRARMWRCAEASESVARLDRCTGSATRVPPAGRCCYRRVGVTHDRAAYSKRSILRNQPLETQRWTWAGIVRNQPQFLIFTTREQLQTLRNWLAGSKLRFLTLDLLLYTRPRPRAPFLAVRSLFMR